MNIKRVISFIGSLITLEGTFMLLPFLVSIIYNEPNGKYFIIFSLCFIVLGLILQMFFKSSEKLFSAEGFVIVSLGWIVLSILGALPFYFSKEIPYFIDSLFETVSGYTTTGATILNDVTSLSKCMNFWRCFTHFVGGMGVLVLILAILPTHSENLLIMKAESPGPQVGKLLPKVSDNARILYTIYFVMTLITIASYILSGMPIYDSICIGMGTAGTGGFVVTKNGCADYSILSQSLIGFFMILFGINFNLYYLITLKKFKTVLKSEELRVYVLIIVISIIIIALNLSYNSAYNNKIFHNSFFQVSSIITTTGFAICDYTFWPLLSRCVLLCLMIIGGCAGSTGGGFKVSRIIINVKSMLNELYLQIHPNSIKVVKFEDKQISNSVIRTVSQYTLIYVTIIILSIILISFENLDFETIVSSVIETFNNVGLGLSKIGPTGNFSIFSGFSKLVFILLMLTGRLEIFPMLILFSKKSWKRFE